MPQAIGPGTVATVPARWINRHDRILTATQGPGVRAHNARETSELIKTAAFQGLLTRAVTAVVGLAAAVCAVAACAEVVEDVDNLTPMAAANFLSKCESHHVRWRIEGINCSAVAHRAWKPLNSAASLLNQSLAQISRYGIPWEVSVSEVG